MSKKIATIISRIFEPAILLPGAFTLVSVRTGVPFLESIFWLTLMVVPVMGYRVWLRKAQNIDWDIRDRKRRVKPLLLLVVFLGLMSALVWMLEPRLVSILLLFFVWVVGFLGITTWVTKISGHTGGDALATGIIVSWCGWNWWPVLLIVPLVAWARVVRHDHTIMQVLSGMLYSWVVLLLFNKIVYF